MRGNEDLIPRGSRMPSRPGRSGEAPSAGRISEAVALKYVPHQDDEFMEWRFDKLLVFRSSRW